MKKTMKIAQIPYKSKICCNNKKNKKITYRIKIYLQHIKGIRNYL